MATFEQETALYVITGTETIQATDTTLMVDMVTWVGNTISHDLKLTDGADNVFIETKCAAATPVVLPFPKPRKLKGLKVATIDSGTCIVYLAQS
ncbi:unnamed protein product [marine sediment metagenome]|uniref:Uncharacterized protein n=1 Tax=marine sediment metagenome TaxID=412755 RepID=X1CX75_9ZZZZ